MPLTLTLASCAVSTSPPAAIALPAVPACLAPVAVAEPQAGEALIIIAARERAARLEANQRIRCGAQLWQQTIDAFAGG